MSSPAINRFRNIFDPRRFEQAGTSQVIPFYEEPWLNPNYNANPLGAGKQGPPSPPAQIVPPQPVAPPVIPPPTPAPPQAATPAQEQLLQIPPPSHILPPTNLRSSGTTTGWDAPNPNPTGMGMYGPPLPTPSTQDKGIMASPPLNGIPQDSGINVSPSVPPFGMPQGGGLNTGGYTTQNKGMGPDMGAGPSKPMMPPPAKTPQTPLNPGPPISSQQLPFGMPQGGGLNTNQPYPQLANVPPPAPSTPPAPILQPTTPPFGMPQNPQLNTQPGYTTQIPRRPTPPPAPPIPSVPPNPNFTRRPTMGYQREEEVSAAPLAYPAAKGPTMGFQNEDEVSNAPLGYPPEGEGEEYPDQPDWRPGQEETGVPPSPNRPNGTPPFSTDYPKVYGEPPAGQLPPSQPPNQPPPDTSGLTPGTVYTPTTELEKQWPTAPPTPKTEEEDINSYLRKYPFDTSMQEKFEALLNSMPEREHPGFWRQFAGFLTGLNSGPEAQENAMYAPYNRKLGDWKSRIEPTLKGAELERQTNVNLTTLLRQERADKIAQQRADTYQEGEERRERQRLDNVEKEKRKDEVNRMKAGDANWEFMTDTNGDVIAVHPRLGRKSMGFKSSDATDYQKYLWDLDRIRTRGEVQQQDKANWERFEATGPDGIRYQMERHKTSGEVRYLPTPGTGPREGYTPPTGANRQPVPQDASPTNPPPAQQTAPQAPPQANKPATTPPPGALQGKGASARDQQLRLQTKVAEAKLLWPDYADYIEWDDATKLPTVEPPSPTLGSRIFGGNAMTPYDQKTYEEIRRYIFGDMTTPGQVGTPSSSSGGQRTTSKGTVVTRID